MAELDTEGVRWCVNEHLSAVDFDAWHRKELAKAWEEGRESLARDTMRPLNGVGLREATPNPYES